MKKDLNPQQRSEPTTRHTRGASYWPLGQDGSFFPPTESEEVPLGPCLSYGSFNSASTYRAAPPKPKQGALQKDGSFNTTESTERAPTPIESVEQHPVGPRMSDGSFEAPTLTHRAAPPKPKQGPLRKDGTFNKTSDTDLAWIGIQDGILENQRARAAPPPPEDHLAFLSAKSPVLAAGELGRATAVPDDSDNVPVPPKGALRGMGLPEGFGNPKKNGRGGAGKTAGYPKNNGRGGAGKAADYPKKNGTGEPSNKSDHPNNGWAMMATMGFRGVVWASTDRELWNQFNLFRILKGGALGSRKMMLGSREMMILTDVGRDMGKDGQGRTGKKSKSQLTCQE